MVFEEKQSMQKMWWIFIPVIIGPASLLIGVLTEDNPAEIQEMWVAFFITLGITLLVVALLFSFRLYTHIDNEGVTLRYTPFIKKRTYAWADIERAWLRKYKPISEYGGWGIKGNFFKKGTAYNVWGNKGLQLYLKNGKNILIGTQKPTELIKFLGEIKEKQHLPQIEKEQMDG